MPFLDKGTQTTYANPYSNLTPETTRRGGRGLIVLMVIVAAAVGVIFGIAKAWLSTEGSPTDAAATAPVVGATTEALDPVVGNVCVDSSGSVVQVDDLPARAVESLAAALTVWPAVPAVKNTVAAPVQAPLSLTVRLVQDNSYTTGEGPGLVRGQVPGFPGLSGKPPRSDDADYATKSAAYLTRVEAARSALTAQGAEVDRVRDGLQVLGKQRSHGSDVLGCVAALAESSGTVDQDILVVSDLADTRLTEPNGATRRFPGKYLRSTRVTIIQACPSGSPQKCSTLLAQFRQGLQRMGLPASAVTVSRSETAADTVDGWLSDLRQESLR